MSRQLGPRRRSPLSLFDLHRDLDSLFGGLWEGPGLLSEAQRASFRDFEPSLDLCEDGEAITVEVELPGVEQKDVDISLTDDLLVIQGEKRAEAKQEEEAVHRVERLYGSFQRAIRLPCRVEADKVQASFKNGVLTVRLPKAPEAQRRRVPIQVQGG